MSQHTEARATDPQSLNGEVHAVIRTARADHAGEQNRNARAGEDLPRSTDRPAVDAVTAYHESRARLIAERDALLRRAREIDVVLGAMPPKVRRSVEATGKPLRQYATGSQRPNVQKAMREYLANHPGSTMREVCDATGGQTAQLYWMKRRGITEARLRPDGLLGWRMSDVGDK